MSPDAATRGCHGDAVAPSDALAARHEIEQFATLTGEVLHVGKRTVVTGRVRVLLRTETVEDVLGDTLRTRRAKVECAQIDREVSEPAKTCQVDDALGVPIVGKILVVERRVQRATVERVPAAGTMPPAAGMDT